MFLILVQKVHILLWYYVWYSGYFWNFDLKLWFININLRLLLPTAILLNVFDAALLTRIIYLHPAQNSLGVSFFHNLSFIKHIFFELLFHFLFFIWNVYLFWFQWYYCGVALNLLIIKFWNLLQTKLWQFNFAQRLLMWSFSSKKSIEACCRFT